MKTDLTEREAALLGPRDMKQPGSKPWAYQMLYSLKRQWQRLDLTVEEWKTTLDELKQYEAWKVLGYPDEEAMLKAEIGRTRAQSVKDVAARAREFTADDLSERTIGIPKGKSGPGRGNKTLDNVNRFIARGGNDADYLAARIARDRPDIHQRMKAGEYKSVRAAALEAGIVKPRISAQADPESVARAIIKYFDRAQVMEIIAALAIAMDA